MHSIKSELREDAIEQAKKGVRKAIRQGEKKRNIEIARKMLKENIGINIISKCTGLNVSDVNNIIQFILKLSV